MSKLKDALICAYNKGYRINDGIVNYMDKTVQVKIDTNGYHVFTIRDEFGERCIVPVHRLVAYQKYGDKMFDAGLLVRHKNGDNKNNLPDNILLGTQSDNMMDISEEVRLSKAITASNAIKKHDHEAIIKLYKEGLTYKQIMGKLGIKSKGTISFIIKKSMEAKK